MKYIKGALFSAAIGYVYFLLTIAMIGFAAAGKIFWWFEWQDNFHFYHITQNFIGIGLAALIPTYIVHSYEQARKWIVISAVILFSMVFHGNINHIFIDPLGLMRFVQQTLINGDIGSVGIFLEIMLIPILWLLVFKRITSR
jgi:hypothetical protein